MKGFSITVALLLLSGCASMESAFSPELRYGQLYALQEALTEAATHCGDREATFTANYWAASTAGNIAEHSQFLKADSLPQSKSRELLRQLYSLQQRNQPETTCRQFADAGSATRELLAALNQ